MDKSLIQWISVNKTNYAIHQGLVVQRMDNAIHRINHYPTDSVVYFVNTYPLDSDLSGGYHYPPFEQLGPDSDLSNG